jgi:hypothetical protein
MMDRFIVQVSVVRMSSIRATQAGTLAIRRLP